MLKNRILEDLKKAVKDLGYSSTDIVLSIPKNSSFGDYSTNLALQLAKLRSVKDKQSPMEIANKIVDRLQVTGDSKNYLEKVEVAGGGFINFFIKDEWLASNLDKVCDLGKPEKLAVSQKIMVEFAHPNTHKAFHIGHLRNIATGESIVRLLEAVGVKVIRANYEGDVGMHIAKAIYALLHISPFKEEIEKTEGVHARVEFLGKAYVAGSKAFESNEQAQKIIKDFNFLIYASAQRFQQEKGAEPSSTDYMKFVSGRTEEVDKVFKLWKETRQWSLDYFETIYKRVYTHFDRYYFESECLAGLDLAKTAVKKGILEENDGAVIFNGKNYGLDSRVFVNSLGLPTYEAKELALAEKEFKEFGNLHKVIHVVGPEQASFFKVTFKAEELLDSEKYKDKQYHLIYGWVRLKSGKMSSRLGEVVLGEWLLDEAKSRIKKEFPEMDEGTLEMVGVGAVKYSMLKFSTVSEISFSFDESISLQGDSGPYIQYTYARAKSVLRKAKEVTSPLEDSVEEKLPVLSEVEVLFDRREIPYGISRSSSAEERSGELPLLSKEEREILRTLEYFEDTIKEAAVNLTPHLIAQYLIETAKLYNLFYQKHRIINAEKEKRNLRLALTYAVAVVLKKGLYLLGIEAPEKM